jgi:hypothetical protein
MTEDVVRTTRRIVEIQAQGQVPANRPKLGVLNTLELVTRCHSASGFTLFTVQLRSYRSRTPAILPV